VTGDHREHIPVLLEPLLELLEPPAGGCALDATVGLGGHARAILQKLGPDGRLIGLDLDADNLAQARQSLAELPGRVDLFARNFAELDQVLDELGVPAVNAIVADLGVSSNQLDDAQRGFSFHHDGPLDMRYDRTQRQTAAELVNRLREAELAELIYVNSQEHFSRRIAKAICRARRQKRITSTAELARIVAGAIGIDPNSRKSKIHPATRTFMALRIAVNRELENLSALLDKAPRYLRPGGRIAVISFHSLEDRLVKRDFLRRSRERLYRILTKKPITATGLERRTNPRSRSAKLRVAERTEEPCRHEPG